MYNCCSVYNPPGGVGGGGTVLGSGTLNYVTKWTPDGTTIGDSQIFDNGTNIGIGTNSGLSYYINVLKNQNANTTVAVTNTTQGTASRAGFLGESEDNSIAVYAYSSTFSNSYFANNAVVYSAKRVLRFIADADGAATGKITWGIGGGTSLYEKLTLLSTGEFGINQTTPTALIHAAGLGSTSATYTSIFQNSSGTQALLVRDDTKVFVNGVPAGSYDVDDRLIVNGTVAARNGASSFYMYNNGTVAGLFRYNYTSALYENFAIGNTTTQLNLMGRVHLSNTATSTSIRCSMYETDSQGVFIFVAGNNTQNGFRWHDSTDTTPLLFLYDDGTLTAKQAALSTTATDGFWYVPSCAGAPTGVPTARTGTIPIVVDSTNNKMYIYSGGAWVALN